MGITQVQADEIVKHKIITSENQEFSPRRADEGQRMSRKGTTLRPTRSLAHHESEPSGRRDGGMSGRGNMVASLNFSAGEK